MGMNKQKRRQIWQAMMPLLNGELNNYEIADKLIEQGVPTPMAGVPWTAQTVSYQKIQMRKRKKLPGKKRGPYKPRNADAVKLPIKVEPSHVSTMGIIEELLTCNMADGAKLALLAKLVRA